MRYYPVAAIDEINSRIDEALDRARRLENIVISMAAVLFLTGLAVFVAGFILERDFAIITGAVLQSSVLWPVKKLIEIRDQNIRLGVIPSLTKTISDDRAQATVLMKLIEKI